MKLLTGIVLTSLTTFAAGLYFPWWSITVTSFMVALFTNRPPGESFLSGFLGVFILWTVMALSISVSNDHILAHRMSQVIIQKDAPFLLILLTGVAGGISGGLAAWTASSLRRLILRD